MNHSDPLDERIRAAKPVAPELPPDFAASMMAEIERQGLAVRPRQRAVLGVWLRWMAAGVLMVAGVLLVNAFAYELRMNGSLELLYFGGRFLGSFLTGLPYDLLLPAVLLAGLAAWLFRGGRLARVRVAWLVLVSYGFTGVGGLALAESGLNERLQVSAEQSQFSMPLFSEFYRQRARYSLNNPHFRMGRVLSRTDGTVVIQRPDGQEEQVVLPPGVQARVGENLRLMGRVAQGRFAADRAQICNPARVRHYFMHRAMMRRHGMGPGMGPGMRGMGPGMGPGMRGMGPGMRGMGPGMGQGMGPGMR